MSGDIAALKKQKQILFSVFVCFPDTQDLG